MNFYDNEQLLKDIRRICLVSRLETAGNGMWQWKHKTGLVITSYDCDQEEQTFEIYVEENWGKYVTIVGKKKPKISMQSNVAKRIIEIMIQTESDFMEYVKLLENPKKNEEGFI